MNCAHNKIALDLRDNIYKCIKPGCWRQFWFESTEQYKIFRHRVQPKFDFRKAELDYKATFNENY
ncbi:hypothetical protein [Spiroplasma clarkii]|nr:hypothetical protein [Spiroplasma clarkii]